jgi:signal transduction histidine kinase/DNA-binding response OmpR family regulator
MIKLFRRLSLSAKLMLIALIPLALLIYFAIEIYKEKNEKLDNLSMYLDRMHQSSVISKLVDELQTERRFSFGYVLSKGWKPELLVQRQKTDEALREMVSNSELKTAPYYTFLDSLPILRARVDNLTEDPMDVMSYYTNAIFRLNNLNVVTAANVSYLESVRADLASQKLLSEMITYIGIMRSNIYYALYTKQPALQAAAGTKGIYDIYNSYVREYEVKSTTEAVNTLRKLARTTNLRPTNSYIENLIRTATYDNRYNAEQWWQISASAVDELKSFQRSLLQKAQAGLTNIYKKEKTARDVTLFFLILAIAFVITIVSVSITAITKALMELNDAAKKISTGGTGIHVKVESKDVIGSLAQSIISVDENNKILAEAASAIGSGKFDVEVVPRGSDDVLGNAVARMKDDLWRFNKENEEKLWIHAGIENINESLRGEKELKQLAADALDALTSYIGGELALLYVTRERHLDYVAGFAVSDVQSVRAKVELGETLIGQAAQQKRLLQLDNVPSDTMKIKSGSMEALPRHVLVIPLIHNNIVEGVVEIASLSSFDSRSLSFINQVTPAVAIAMQGAKSRERLQELFQETQAQSEELQAQHNELENINAELEAQTEKLQASEEELKVQQEELMQANQEMEERSRLLEERNQLIVEKNMEIQQKVEELALSTRYKSEFLANMSHELRTPLNSVLLLSRLLGENNDENLMPEQVEYAKVIQSSGQGLLTLIDEILDLSKIEAGKMELEFQPVLINEIVHDMNALFGPIAKEKGLQFYITVDEHGPSQIETDKLRLEQVIKNLLSNALKFTSQGSVSLTVTSLRENSSFVEFSVKDTGIGIPQETQALIFEAFKQADGSTRRNYGGTGLGLSISRELTRLLGGEIKVASEVGKGSEFTIYIPVQKTEAPPAQEVKDIKPEESKPVAIEKPEKKAFRVEAIPNSIPDDRSEARSNDKTILIIEDDTAFAKALLDFTHKKGYKGLVAVRGDEGIALAQQYNPLGILLDIQLPVKDGWEVMEELKSNPATRHIPVHMMSSLEAKRESMVKGAVDFINKPLAFEQMQEVFNRIEHVLAKEPKKVLIVEENPKHAKALAYYLENFNVSTEVSNSVNTGIDALKRQEVDCVILDMGIPDRHGYETLETLKKSPGFENLPIIIFTGKSLSKNEELRIKQYADSIVIKTAHSYQRVLDEVSLFLHLVEENNNEEKQSGKYRRLGALNEVLADKKVLVVDDDVRNIYSLTKALELHNMQVITAVDGKEALNQLQANPDTSVVLMDIMMPEMDGYEAMQSIRKKREFKNLPIIAVTAKAMSGDREKCIQAGASDYISKPVDVDQLLSLLRVWLYDKSI